MYVHVHVTDSWAYNAVLTRPFVAACSSDIEQFTIYLEQPLTRKSVALEESMSFVVNCATCNKSECDRWNQKNIVYRKVCLFHNWIVYMLVVTNAFVCVCGRVNVLKEM